MRNDVILVCAPWCQLDFLPLLCFSKTIRINIIDDEEYEKNKNFFLEIGEPRLLEMSERKGGGVAFLFLTPPTNNL